MFVLEGIVECIIFVCHEVRKIASLTIKELHWLRGEIRQKIMIYPHDDKAHKVSKMKPVLVQ